MKSSYALAHIIRETHAKTVNQIPLIDELLKTLQGVLPTAPGPLRADLEKNLRAAMQQGLARMNLVTREELEVQEAVLARTREKLEALEKQVAALEEALKNKT